MREFLKRPSVKAVVLSALTTFTSATTSALGDWSTTQAGFKTKLFWFSGSVLLYLIVLALYTAEEVNERRTIEILQRQNDAFEDVMSSVILLCQQNATDVNTCIHRIVSENMLDLSIWNFNRACQWVCEHIYKCLQVLRGSKNFEVVYVKLIEGEPKEDNVMLVAYANQNQHKPTIYNVKRCFDGTDDDGHVFHDLELFKRNTADTEVIIGSEKIEETFAFRSKDSRNKNKGRYTQYVGVPLFCDNRKMVGLLEVVSFQGSDLGITEKEIEEVANKYLIPYANFILLLHKLEKALVTGRV